MKTIMGLTVFVFCCLFGVAQTPQAINYQAVARNISGEVLANQQVSFKISILSGSATGPVVYSETHPAKTTNPFGLVNLTIGKGTPVTGTLTAVAWESGNYYLKVEMDPAGGSSYQSLGASQLVSVPYALQAKQVETETDGDPDNEIQDLELAGNVLGLTKSTKTVTLPSSGGLELPYQGSATTGMIIFELTCNGGQGLTSTAWLPGLVGKSTSPQSTGVLGEGATGVTGRSNSATGAGISGQQINSSGYSGYFSGGKFCVNGNVGINTSSPSEDVTIFGASGVATMNLVNTGSGGNSTDGLKLSLGNNASGYLINQENAPLVFGTNNTNRIIIQANGNIGIGTTIPSFLMDLNGPINLNKAVASGIAMYCKGDEALWYNGTYFSWGYAGTYNFIGNKLKIGGNGNVAPGYTLYVDGTAAKSSAGTAWVVSSDQRLKNVYGAYNKGLAEISRLKPVVFSYRNDNPRNLPHNTREVGFLAQEVQKIFPEAVSEAKDGFLDFNIHYINVAMVNAINELTEENTRLRERLEKLEQLMGISAQK